MPGISTFLNRMLALTIELQGVLFTAFEQLLNARIEGAIAAGTYDVGLETVRAESFVVTGRQTIYTHPGTGAETRLLTIAQRQRNRPLTLDEALSRLRERDARLLVNARSGRAAVQVHAPSVMLDDGEVEYRVRLIRPMEAPNVPVRTMAESHWQDTDEATFAAAWTAELAEVPAFTDSTLLMVSGLLLPIWKRLPNESTRVYRLQTDDGERIIGRKVSPAWAATATATGLPSLTPDEAFAALIDGKTVIDLAEGLQLRRVRVMGGHRIELSGFTDTMCERLTAYGLFHEIISWKLRMFVPTDTSGPTILAKVMDRYPVDRAASGRRPDVPPRRFGTGAPSRAQCRGRVPSLLVQWPPRRPLLDGRRRAQHARPLAVRAPHRPGERQGRGRQVDRRRDRRAWRPARCHPRKLRPRGFRGRREGGTRLSQPAAARTAGA